MTLLAKIHIAKKQLGLDDDTYRALLLRVTGKASAKDMSDRQRQAVLDEMQRQGFKPASKVAGTGRKVLSGPYAKKAQALWISLWNLGAVQNRTDHALLAFFERQTGIARSEWVLDAKDGQSVVEALKSWLEREGVDWAPRTQPAHLGRDGFRVAVAQWRKLGGVPGAAFWGEVSLILKRSIIVEKPTDAEWITIMNAFGKRIRERPQAQKAVA